VIEVVDYDARIRAERRNDRPDLHVPTRSSLRPLLRAA
jgi:hypothetical protein